MTNVLPRLSYAEFNARLDAMRKVLVCPCCEERAPWTDAAGAVVRGWSFQDRKVDGEVVRFWYCPEHKPLDLMPPLRVHVIARTLGRGLSMKDLQTLPFSDARKVLVQLGENAGKQLAVVLHEGDASFLVVGFRVSSGEWTQPKFVAKNKTTTLEPKDKRLRSAANCWPPPRSQKGNR
jgi:hypothetical protein